jgi:hypothetical protein
LFAISGKMAFLSTVIAFTSSVISFPMLSRFSSLSSRLSGLSGCMKPILLYGQSLAKWPSLLQLKHLFTLSVIFQQSNFFIK